MRHRITVLFSLFVLVTVVTTGALAASPAPRDEVRGRVASRALAQASPVAAGDPVVGNIRITITDGETSGEFKVITTVAEIDGYIEWHNESSVALDLEVTIQGVATHKVTLESEATYYLKLHTAGTVHWSLPPYEEGGILQ